jgi:hypothetical protein
VLFGALATTGCARIVSGSNQQISFSTTPAGATVIVDGVPSGTTPVTVPLARKHAHLVRIELAGFAPYEMRLERDLNGWFVGNVAFGWAVGIIVDISSGAMFKLTPSEVTAALNRGGALSPGRGDALHVVLATEVNPSRVPIGRLARR